MNGTENKMLRKIIDMTQGSFKHDVQYLLRRLEDSRAELYNFYPDFYNSEF